MELLIQRDPVAHALIIATVIAAVGCEAAATYLGQARDGQRRVAGSLLESVFLIRRRDDARPEDRWTKQFLIGALLAGLLGAYLLTKQVPSSRAGADNGWTFALGIGVAIAGIGLRSWAVWTLGRYFRREVTIEPGQQVIRKGPYRWVRHPAYAGNVITYTGIGLALGSWVGAAILLVATLVGVLPRIRVEERALERSFGRDYASYRLTTARLIPHVW